jgi:hypothetical protein
MSTPKQVAAAVIILGECVVFGRERREMWAKNWMLGRDRFTHLNLLNSIRNDSPEDYRNYFRMSDVLAKVKLTLSVCVAVWIRETGLGPPTHV